MILLRPYFHVEGGTQLQWRPNPRGGTYQTLIDFADMPVAAENVSGVLVAANIPTLDASKIGTGTLDLARLPTLPHSGLSGLSADDHTRYLDTTPSTTARNRILPTVTSAVNITTRSVSGQTANHWQLEAAAGTIFSFFDRFGRLTLNPQGLAPSTIATLGISTQNGDPGLIIRLGPSPSAVAFQVQNSANTPLATIQNTGRLDAAGVRVTADPGAGAAGQLTLTHTTITPGNVATPAGYLKMYIGTQAIGVPYYV